MAVISNGQRNTHLKFSCLIFSPEGFAGVSEARKIVEVYVYLTNNNDV